ncbi:FG-GAP-like repeat-containing protein [Actinacidiphila acidipaludis]|uniref:FG-GAP-like repeat-containing protein n=1 Tax=Actinacidiphila acidipaludis TaxID=2873382 RepID=A0ABS7Q2D7_9ACTN|nr:FG-GAP-like repeat-containing protein [Streptomyces acidipaludis]MBY8877296.1 FG-GAP-like repeat-containing protein [Streptomyces acidipaludis]
MKRAVQARACAAGVTTMCALTLGLGAVASQAGTAFAAAAQDVRIAAPDAVVPRDVSIVAAGQDGVLEQEDGTAGYSWISTANRQVKPVAALDGVPRDAFSTQGADFDEVAYTTAPDGPTQVVWVNVNDGTEDRLTLEDGYLHPHVQRHVVLVSQKLDDGTYQYRILGPSSDGSPSDVAVPLPEGATGDADPVILASSGVHVVVGYQQNGHRAFGLLNLVRNSVVALPAEADSRAFSMTGGWITWFSREGTAGIRYIAPGSVGETTAAGIQEITPASATSEVHTFQVGDNILWYEGDHGPLHLIPILGQETARVVLPDVTQAVQEPNGALDVVSQAPDGSRTVHNLSVDGSGLVFDLALRDVPPATYYGSVRAVSLDRGTVRFANSLRGTLSLVGKDVGTGLQPVAGGDLPAEDVSGPGRFADGGDEGLARLVTDQATGHDALVTAADTSPVVLPESGGSILGVSPQYVLYQAGDGGRQYVVDIVQNKVVLQQAPHASALNNALLWTAGTAPGRVTVTDLRNGTWRTVDLGGDCVPDELQAGGTMVYWNCGDRAGVNDLADGQAYAAPTAGVLLGDHFIATNPPNSTEVDVTELYDGTETPVAPFRNLKATTAADSRGVTWTVDPRTGEVAFVDTSDVVHVAQALPDHAHLSPLTVADRSAAMSFDTKAGTAHWAARWWLSKPAADWRVDLADVNGVVVRSWTGTAARSSVNVSWDGRSTAGKLVPNGAYTWKVTAAPADKAGPSSVTSGTVSVTGAAPAPAGLFGRDTTGTLWQYASTGNASAPYSARRIVGGGWQAYNALATPDGMRADGSGELVARDSAGVLWYYQGTGTNTPPLKARVKIGSGWSIYDRLVGVRDVTGDGRADLVTRDASGVLWLYRGTGNTTTPFATRTKIGAGWNTYSLLTGTGDVTGDGRPDLVARDTSGVLWLYRGTGNTTTPFATRTKIGAGWNTYSLLTGTGDVTGDGRPDLVARDTSGVLWLYRGTGNATTPFATRTKIGAGWNTYNTLM